MGARDRRASTAETPGPSRQFLALALDCIGEAVTVTDAAGTIVLWNGAASRLFGWSEAEAAGRPLLDMIGTTTTREPMMELFDAAWAGSSWQGELLLQHQDHSMVAALVVLTPMRDDDGSVVGIAAIARDMTELHQSAVDLRTSNELFQALLHGTGDLFAITDSEGVVRSIVGPVESLLGLEPDAIVGSSIFDLVAPADLERARRLWAIRLTTTDDMLAEDYWIKRSDDTWRCLSLLVNNLLEAGDVGGIVITARDVTARKHLEQARMTLAGTNAALVHATNETELFGQICRILVHDTTYHLAWIGLADPSRPLGVRMIGLSDTSLAFFEALQHLAGEHLYRGPLTTTLETRETAVVDDIAALDEAMPWRRLALDFGYRSMIALPLAVGNDEFGVLAIYSEEPHAFSADAVAVLTDLARDLTHGIDGLRTRADRVLYKTRLDQSLEAAVEAIAAAGELRDPYTAGHQRRVSELAVAIGRALDLDSDLIAGIRIAASIHDIGKLAIPAEILSKPGPLTAAESALIEQHVQAGHDIVCGIDFPWPVADLILQHHERLDGSGYPAGLHHEQIPISSRIMAIADTVEAMQAHRPYRPALGLDRALATIEAGRDTLFDAEATDACCRLFREEGFTFSI
jgi:PAS domain S-box-containing protein